MKFHENLHVVAFAAAMIALGAQAAPVSSAQVRRAVSAWASVNGSAFANPGSVESVTPAYADDGSTVLYWVAAMSNGGAVIVAPDTDIDPIVAVLEKWDGAFPAGHPLPSILKFDMANRLSVIAGRGGASGSAIGPVAGSMQGAQPGGGSGEGAVSEEVKASVASANSKWAKYGRSRLLAGAATLAGGDASPFVRRIVDGFESGGRYTHWNQAFVNGNYCYNRFTPEHAVCGCVATAGSAILQFFNCTNDVGSVLGNPTWSGNPVSAPYNTTRAGAIDWSILPKSFGGQKEGDDKLDDAGYDLLGRVAFNMGVLVDMMWDSDGPGTESGAFLSKLVAAFKAHGFKTARHVTFDTGKSADNANQFTKTVYAQVWCGAPVALGISSDAGGHAVIACGYARDPDGDQFCRVFMGWAGTADAWYSFPQIQDYKLVTDAVTMIGYHDNAVVPVFGEANTPGVELTLPGYVTNSIAVTTTVNENGFFGIRVPTDMADLTIAYAPRNKSATINPYDSSVLSDESSSREDLDGAVPDEIPFSILNTTVKYTMESADAVAERDGKALLMVSGTMGSPRTKALMDYLYYLDETTDMSNRFVLVFNSVGSSDSNRPDGDPSIGVFDPLVFEASERWQESNGRLFYTNFIDSVTNRVDESGNTVSEIVYTFSELDTTSLTNDVPVLLDSGFETYLRQTSDVKFVVTGVNGIFDPYAPYVEGEPGPNAAYEVGVSYPGYGTYSGGYTNGETVLLSAPGVFTNEAEGVIYRCVGWSTNQVFYRTFNTMGIGYWEMNPYNSGTNASVELHSGDEVTTLTWIWERTHCKVSSEAMLSYKNTKVDDAVTPALSWCEVGSRVTISAASAIDTWGFNEWSVKTVKPDGSAGVDYENYNGSSDERPNANLNENGTNISFTVYAPISVIAKYEDGVAAKPSASYAVSFSAEPAELQDSLPVPVTHGSEIAWGDATFQDRYIELSPGADVYVDSTGGVWKCTGWLVDGNLVQEPSVVVMLNSLPTSVSPVWELQVPELPEPDPIAFTSIVRAAEDKWIITMTNGVTGCWYHLYVTNSLPAGTSDWPYAVTDEANPQQAAADGEVVFHATGGGDRLYWKAEATSTEEGDE